MKEAVQWNHPRQLVNLDRNKIRNSRNGDALLNVSFTPSARPATLANQPMTVTRGC